MSLKTKHVSYSPTIEENNDYLVPLQYDDQRTKINPFVPIKIFIGKPKASTTVLSSIFLPISLILYVPVAICQLIIGLIYFGQCPVQEMIVVWMIVSGISGIILLIIGLVIYQQMQNQFNSYPPSVRILLPIFIVVLLFVIGWFFAGQVFVFEVKIRVEFFDTTLPEYCHGNLYKAAYILIFIDYLIFFLAIILNVLSCITPPEDTKSKKNQDKDPLHGTKI